MKILRITDLGFETGGVESGLVLVQPLLENRNYIIKTLASNARPDLPHFNQYGYKTFSRFDKIFFSFNPYAWWALKKALRDFQPDVVDIHTIGEASPSIFFALKKYPTVLTVHGPETFSKKLLLWCFPEACFKNNKREISDLTFLGRWRYRYHRFIHDPLFTLGFRNVDAIVTLSHYMHDLMKQEGLDNKYIANGSVLFDYQPLEKETLTYTLAYVGRLEKLKGVDYLLRSLPGVIAKFPDTQLLIAGDGAAKEDFEKLSVELGLTKNVKFLGHLDRQNLAKLYQQTSIVIMPSAYPEAFGKVGIEAMSVGRPVIATNVGGISDWLIDGETGFLVPPFDSAALTKNILKLLSDYSLLMQMGKKARTKSEEFDLNKYISSMEEVYKKVIVQHKQKQAR